MSNHSFWRSGANKMFARLLGPAYMSWRVHDEESTFERKKADRRSIHHAAWPLPGVREAVLFVERHASAMCDYESRCDHAGRTQGGGRGSPSSGAQVVGETMSQVQTANSGPADRLRLRPFVCVAAAE
jgi:hypothetical protein